MLAVSADGRVINDVAVERFPNIATVDSAVHAAGLITIFIIDYGLDTELVRFKRGGPADRPLFVFDFVAPGEDIFCEAVFL